MSIATIDSFTAEDLPTSYDPSCPKFPVPARTTDLEWGHYLGPVRPAYGCRNGENEAGLRVAVFGSFQRGAHVLSRLIRETIDSSLNINLVGLATDETNRIDPFTGKKQKPRITAARRVWQYIPRHERGNYKDLSKEPL